MKTRQVLLVDAFTDEPLTGNAVGVVPDADGLTDAQQQAIARELHASVTAFVFDSDRGACRFRCFTPSGEVDVPGHAVVSAFTHLYRTGAIETGTHEFETNTGIPSVTVEDDGCVLVKQERQHFETVDVDYDDLADVLDVPVAALDPLRDELPVASATTGIPVLVVPVDFLSPLINASPDVNAISSLCAAHDAVGVYAFTFDALAAESTLHARMWTPLADVPEELVTGAGSAACAAYLRYFDALEPSQDDLVFELGHVADRPVRVRVRLDEFVCVGGRAVTSLDGSLVVPDREDESILEA